MKSVAFHTLSLLSDCASLFDVLIQFNVALERDGVIIEDRKVIMRQYLKGTFLIDLLSGVPWDRFESKWHGFMYVHCVTIVVRLSRMRRMSAIQTRMEKLQYRIDNKLVWMGMNVVKLFSVLILLAHWFACLWFFLGESTEGIEDNWFSTAVMTRDDFWSCYVASLYFCITTMITVGYGDTHAVNEQEKIFAMCIMMTAWMVLLVISGVLTSTIVRYDEQGAKFSEMMNRSMKYMIRNHIDSQLQSFVRTFLLQQIDHEATEEVHEELMTHLDSSSRMKSEVYVGLWGKHLKKYGWFSRFPPYLLGNVCSACRMNRYSPGDVVVRAGNIGDGMHFVIKGRLVETVSSGGGGLGRLSLVSKEGQSRRELTPGEFFGEVSLFIPFKWTSEVRCETYCEILFVPTDKLEQWMSENEQYMLLLRNQRAVMALVNAEFSIFSECLSAGVDPNYCDPDNNFFLHTAIKMRHSEGVDWLLDHGAVTGTLDVNTNMYPLQLALQGGDIAMIDAVSAFQDMSKFVDSDPPPIADVLVASASAQTLVLFAAAAGGYNRVLAFLLDKCKTHINVNDVFSLPAQEEAERRGRLLGGRYVGFGLADLAASHGHTDVIDSLCDHQADFNAAVNERPKLPLHYAVEAGQKEAVSRLVKHGALIVVKDQFGATPLDVAYKLEREERDAERLVTRRAITLMLRGLNLHDLSKDGKVDELSSAIRDKCDPNIIHPKTGRTPLQYAADANQVAVIKELLTSRAEIDFTGVSQVTALYSALMKGHLDAARTLIEGGADPNKAVGNGSTPLMAAIKKGSMPLVDLLLSNRAQPIVEDVKAAFEKKDKAMVTRIKNALGSDMWAPYLQGESMFHQFCRKGDVAIVSLALEFNADVLRQNGDKLSPLDIAASAGKDKVCDSLIKAAKLVLTDDGMREYVGKGLVSAVKVVKGTLPVIKLLLAAGGDVGYPELLVEAIKASHVDAVTLLLESGAKVTAITAEAILTLVVGGQLGLIQSVLAKAEICDENRPLLMSQWGIVDSCLKAKDIEKTEIFTLLCETFKLDPTALELQRMLPGTTDRPGSGLTGLDLESGSPRKRIDLTDVGPSKATVSGLTSRLANVVASPRMLSSGSMSGKAKKLASKLSSSLKSFLSRSKHHV